MADSIITNLILELGNLVAQEYQVLQSVGDELRSLEDTLRFMKRFLRNSEGKHDKHESVSELINQINEVAFEAEDVIENFILYVEKQQRRNKFEKAFHVIEHTSMLKKVAQQIAGIKKRIIEIYENKEKFEIEMGEASNNPHFEATLLRRRKEVDENMVGFRDVEDLLLKKLTEGPTSREVISIVGMGGLGKTTVAKSLHNHRIIEDHFTCRAWVTVSEDYNTRQVVLDILNKVIFDVVGLDNLETDKLKDKLRECLTNKKYVVFLDDIWQTDMWDEVEPCLPDKSNGSRVLITTRKADVARYSSPREPHFLRYLKDDEGWELFEKKVFRGDRCPPHLKMVGMNIVNRCKGLPLSIVVIASMLASQEKSERIWERTLMDVGAQLNKDEVCLDILALSYHNLPVMLKPCVLYFAAFPEDHEMSVKRLIALWLAEGFVQPLGELNLDEVAESYLDDLIDRSLVQAGKKRTDGGLKTCRIHDLVRDLCIREARRENFMWAAFGIHNSRRSSPRRLSFHRHTTRSLLSKDWDPSSIRALISFESQLNHASTALWKKLYTEYKLIRILDLGTSVKVETMPNDISSLINLRYLRLFLISSSIPNSIFDLWNLKILFLEGNQSLKVRIGELLKLQYLEQLVLGKSKIFGNATTLLTKNQLKSLHRLSSILPDNDFESAVMNGLCPELRKLSVWCSYTHIWSLKKLFSGLPYLESLKFSFSGGDEWKYKSLPMDQITRNLNEDDIPSSLTKITLESGIVTYKVLQMLGKFPNLRILKLADIQEICGAPAPEDLWKVYAFYIKYKCDKDLNQLYTPKGAFPRLQTFHLDNIRQIIVSSIWGDNGFVQLRQLFVKRCTIYDLDYLLMRPSLNDVQVLWLNEQMARQIEKLKQDNKINYRLLVYRG